MTQIIRAYAVIVVITTCIASIINIFVKKQDRRVLIVLAISVILSVIGIVIVDIGLIIGIMNGENYLWGMGYYILLNSIHFVWRQIQIGLEE